MTRHCWSHRLTQFLALMLLISATPARADHGHPGRHINTDGHGSVTAVADTADLNLRVSLVRRDPLEAKNRVETLVNGLFSRMQALGIPESSLKASAIRVDAEYNVSRVDGSRELAGYRITRPVVVTLDQLDRLDEVIRAAIEDSSVTIGQVSYTSSQADEHTAEARRLAVEDSYGRARFLADSYAGCLGPAYSISFRDGPSRPGPMMQEMARSAAFSDDAAYVPGQYTPGEVIFQASVQVVFDLELDCD